MKRLASLTVSFSIPTVLAGVLLVAPVPAQIRPDPGPEEPRTQQMMRMMREMRGDMDRMRGDMQGQGSAAMRERMEAMAARMERMTQMMERHQRELQAACPRMAPPAKPAR
jgi:hypothetical protein